MGQHLHVDFKIRLPAELKEQIRESAKNHNRTMTADIVARLEESFKLETHPYKVPMDIKVKGDFFADTELSREQIGELLKQLAFERLEQLTKENQDKLEKKMED